MVVELAVMYKDGGGGGGGGSVSLLFFEQDISDSESVIIENLIKYMVIRFKLYLLNLIWDFYQVALKNLNFKIIWWIYQSL